MNEERATRVFFEIHRDLPREGPGDSRSTRKALSMLEDLPDEPRILDIGCGPGMQTLDLAAATNGLITAVDNWQPFLDQLEGKAAQEALRDRIETVNADMAALDFEDASFDLVWSEGAAYIMGFGNALHAWKRFLKVPGYLAVSEIAWLRADPPEEVREYFAEEYPAMRDIETNLEVIRGAGFSVIGHFPIPESAWWENYYTPIESKLPAFRDKYRDDPAALAVVELHEKEIDLFRRYSGFYGYVFFVARLG